MIEHLLCAVHCFWPGAESGQCGPCSLVELGSTEGEIIIKLKKNKTGHVVMEGKRRSFDKGRAGQDGGGEQEAVVRGSLWEGDIPSRVCLTRKDNRSSIRRNILEGRGMSGPLDQSELGVL